MNKDLLKKHINKFVKHSIEKPKEFANYYNERLEICSFYQGYDKDKILKMTEEDVYEYVAPLWAMLIWGNKSYVVNNLIIDNGLEVLRQEIAELVWGSNKIEERWDRFRKNIKGIGPAMMSEILCKSHPNDFMLWNRRAYVALNYLGVKDLPRHNYQLNGKTYKRLCDVSQEIAVELQKTGFKDSSLLAVDYFIWDELQVEDNLANLHKPKVKPEKINIEKTSKEESIFIHNEIRDKLRDIGQWLGFTAKIEQKVADGSKVDTIWEATIGNMGRVIYVFEVQTKGSIDSLIVNLLKSLNNPAVQGVVAVSDKSQLEKIRKHSADVRELRDKLKCWDYEEILQIWESLEYTNNYINNLGLVPKGF